MNTDRPTVTIPLDEEYLTSEGLYVAGYLCGEKWQEEAAYPNAPQTFLEGLIDARSDRRTTKTAETELIHPIPNGTWVTRSQTTDWKLWKDGDVLSRAEPGKWDTFVVDRQRQYAGPHWHMLNNNWIKED